VTGGWKTGCAVVGGKVITGGGWVGGG